MPQANDNHITPIRRQFIEDRIERLIAILDAADPDPDLEPSLAGGICTDDREGDSADDEPELGWTGDVDQERALRSLRIAGEYNHSESEHDDREPSLGSLDQVTNQTWWAAGDHRDLEADYVGFPDGVACGFTADEEREDAI